MDPIGDGGFCSFQSEVCARSPDIGDAPKCNLSICLEGTWVCEFPGSDGLQWVFMKKNLESDHPMNAVRPEDAELALVIAAKIDETTAPPAGAG
jgi:hypothetical protein